MTRFLLTLAVATLFLVGGAHVPASVADRLFDIFLAVFLCGGGMVLVVCAVIEGILALRGGRTV